jgi:two-component system OmpR family sensor kinase
MGTGLIYRISFHRRLFLSLLAFALTYLLFFLFYQYSKEKEYKLERLNDQLQIVDVEAGYAYRDKEDMAAFVKQRNKGEFAGLRITVIDMYGTVLYDSQYDAKKMPNHLTRPEVHQAIIKGDGYMVGRYSHTANRKYFYNAKRVENIIVRSALPYTLTLIDVLRVNSTFIWFMVLWGFLFALLAYALTRKLGHNINHLREFAAKAERGEKIDNIEPFMHDELGDVSNAIVRLYIKLRQTKDALLNEHNMVLHQEQEQQRIKRQLTQNINHELKTPVSSIEGYLETIINNPQIDEEKKDDFIKKCYNQVIRMSHLLGDISTITRMDEASNIIEKEWVCISKLIREVFEDMSPKLAERHISYSLDIPDDLNMVGNESLLQSIFRNLLDNAIAYSGCNHLFIRLVEESPERFVFSFADNGVGIDEVHLPHIFERFYRIDKGRSRKLGGTGLGLSIVKNAVVFHGGAIVARTRGGGGLEFVFTLNKGRIDGEEQ